MGDEERETALYGFVGTALALSAGRRPAIAGLPAART